MYNFDGILSKNLRVDDVNNSTFCGDTVKFSRSGPLFDSLGTLPWQPILGKICEMTFIQHVGISQRIEISQFRLRGDKGRNVCYILCNFGEDLSTNPNDLAGNLCTFWDERAKIDISYQISQQILDRTSLTFQHY